MSVSLSLVRDLCFVDSESNCLCAREGGRTGEGGVVVRGQSFARFIPSSLVRCRGRFSHFSGMRTFPKI